MAFMVTVRPSQFLEIVVQPEDDLCERMKKTFIRLPILLYKLVSYMFTIDGNFTSSFAADLCDIPCTPESVNPTTPT